MRATIAALALLTGCSAGAQPMCQYDLYIYQPVGGASVYAADGSGAAAAVEVESCGHARLLSDAQDIVQQLRDRRRAGDLSVVTVEGPHSRTYLGPCGSHEDEADGDAEEEAEHDDTDNLVVIENASGAQMRRMIQSLDAAPRQMREEMISTLGLRSCNAGARR
jgi:hypothetical protein